VCISCTNVNTIRCKTTCVDNITCKDETFTVLNNTCVCQTKLTSVHTKIHCLRKTRVCFKRLTSECVTYQSVSCTKKCVDTFSSVKTTVGCVEPKCV